MDKARANELDKSADLSEAARAAVRDAGDPRIDAHLAAMGLLPEPAQAPQPAQPAQVAEPTEPADLAALRTENRELEAALATARRRILWAVAALVAALVGLSLMVILLLTRTA